MCDEGNFCCVNGEGKCHIEDERTKRVKNVLFSSYA